MRKTARRNFSCERDYLIRHHLLAVPPTLHRSIFFHRTDNMAAIILFDKVKWSHIIGSEGFHHSCYVTDIYQYMYEHEKI
jgi:hypothetical protein